MSNSEENIYDFKAKLRLSGKVSRERGLTTLLLFDVLVDLDDSGFFTIKPMLEEEALRRMKIKFIEAYEKEHGDE